ncbi:G-box-binding factor 4-like isoform X2 [Juglans microcarpa x Juglans regia]|uniref:G-box-binding factor 4-like isoform X2 n=1 Tax=Juglans microcarpa x Juglans regia TaxID=2249226 RepID=UPI001B7EA2A7|nr:G-box-binding factor 4-like isoform X2 [Juglans microcarpa x Juglans regia]
MASSKVMTSTNSNSRKPDQPRRASSSSVTKAQSLSDHARNTSAKANDLGSSSMTVDGLLRTVYDSNPSTTESTLLDAQITVMETPIPVPSDSHPNGSSHAPKTVEEVWREIVSGDRKECKVEAPDEMMTLEDFLAKAGAVEEEEMKVLPSERLSGGVFAFDSVTPSQFAALDSVDGAIVGFGNGVDVIAGAGAGAGAGRGKRGRAVLEPLDKAAQQRQRRMIKNRESAARSRERKQAERAKERFKQIMEKVIPVVEKRRPPRELRRVHSMQW